MTNIKNNKKGQGMTEYLIIVALIAVTTIGIVNLTGNSVKVGFGKIANALQGKTDESKATKVKDEDTKTRNMSDFNTGVVK